MAWSLRFALCVLFTSFVLTGTPTRAALTAYYTLDNTTTGIANQGTTGAVSNLVAANGGASGTTTGIIGGGALTFAGGFLTATTAGNAGDLLSAYPFTMSIWVNTPDIPGTTASAAAMSVSLKTPSDQYFQIGAFNDDIAEMVVRNGAFQEVNSTANISGGTWRLITAVYAAGSQTIYVDGKASGTPGTLGTAFPANLDALSIGGLLRNNVTTPSDPFPGSLDDAGLFNTALTAADAALINGLGRTGGIGLDQLDEAQALLAASTGSTALIGGATWQRVTGLTGTIGDWGGSVSGGNAFIVAGAGGDGLQLVATAIPEPGTWAALAILTVCGFAVGRRRV
ncbi:MAG: PEP-CTERM sorting domain-containing protein [Pirellulales bacterium]